MATRIGKRESSDIQDRAYSPIFLRIGVPLVLGVMAFLIYWPSLRSDFVYDARDEILKEGFITNLSNLPDVISLKVLKMQLILADRPGQLLYLMLIAMFSGKEPWGYHWGSNLLHAANVVLLFFLLQRLVTQEQESVRGGGWRRELAVIVATLLFALHPIAVEAVSSISYSSDLLVVFFTLAALIAATHFRPTDFRSAFVIGGVGVVCATAAVTCKESGMAVSLVLVVYWLLFRRMEPRGPWLVFLGLACIVPVMFLTARFVLAAPNPYRLEYLGGSFPQVFLIQPRLWVFMMGKLVWPVALSADYTVENADGITMPMAIAVLLVVILAQVCLAANSRLGALGVAIYWLGLASVSNLFPLYRILADRFYYLPLAGVVMQLLALFLIATRYRPGFTLALAACVLALFPLSVLTLMRQFVFADEVALWTDTLQASPSSWMAHNGLGSALFHQGKVEDSIQQFQQALEIHSNYAEAHNNLGNALSASGQTADGVLQYQAAIALNPGYADAHYNLGSALFQQGQVDAAIEEYQRALQINPNGTGFNDNLGIAFLQKGEVDQAVFQFQKSVTLDPKNVKAHNNLGIALANQGHLDQAVAQFQESLRLDPNSIETQQNLAKAKSILEQNNTGK